MTALAWALGILTVVVVVVVVVIGGLIGIAWWVNR